MKVTLHGAAGGDVTGSAYLVETQQARVLVDFGLFQGVAKSEQRNRVPKDLNPRKLDAVLLTHAHLDHTGRLPLLVKAHCDAPVFGTPATGELTDLILRDSAKVQAQDIERVNRRRQRAGQKLIEPLYGVEEVDAVRSRFRPVPYRDPIEVAPGVTARWVEAGHMLGSASIHLTMTDAGGTATAVFSGDLGPKNAPILKDAEPFHQAQTVFLESTYGARNHRPFQETVDEFVGVLQTAISRNGKVLVPTFAVGRAQLLLVILAGIFRQRLLPKFPVYLDSPMAIEATKIYRRHVELFDEDLTREIREQPLEDDLNTVQATVTAEESKALNHVHGPCLIMAGAGMCNAGRILHHLRQNLWRPDTHVIFVGYQGDGSLGRRLVDGAKLVSIFGERIAVRAKVHTMGGFSAHAGQDDLLAWFAALAPCRPRVILTHGEANNQHALAEKIRETYQLTATIPQIGETVTL
ncbi:MAG: MBL fold metallo-hydrolase [Pirellulaceae bacterium]|nr:MBL fold metallo-hydrolase [Pirellulaceae bacterium]